jgi:parallel beta-helix repeat protein
MSKRIFQKITTRLIAASLIILLALGTLPALPARAAAITSAASGSWSAPATWVGGIVPGASDDVTIANGHTVAFDLPSATVNSLTIQTGTKATALTISGTNALTVAAAVAIGAPTASNITNSLVVEDGSLRVGTTLTITGGSSTTRKSELAIGSGAVTVSGGINVPNARSRVTFTGAGTLNVTGAFQSTGTLTPGTGLVNYTGSAQTVGAYAYNSLALSGSGSKTFAAGTSVAANMFISGSAKADIGAGLTIAVNALALGGTGQVAGTWGSTSSVAANKNDTYFTLTTGMLNVATALAATAPSVSTSAATSVGRTSAVLNGSVNPHDSSTIVTFEYGTTSSYGSTLTAGQSPVTGAVSVPVSIQVPGLLLPNTTYHFRAVGVNAAGRNNGSDRTFTTSSVGSAAYYVDKTNILCSDGGSGTELAPFCTISHAADLADAGDTVHVVAGSYAETVKPLYTGGAGMPLSFLASKGVTVTGEAGNTTSGNAFRMTSKGYIIIDGFTITGTADYGIYAASSNHITISNNQVSNSGAAPNYRSGIYVTSTTDSTVSGNTSDHNTGDGIRLNKGSNNNWVEKNVVFGNALGTVSQATGINLLANSNYNWIIRNTAYANEDTGLNFYTGSSHNMVVNNLSYGNGDHGIDNSAAPYNTFIGNTVQGNVTVGINLEEDLVGAGSGGATLMNNISVDNGYRRQVGGGTLTTANPGNIRIDSSSTTGTTMNYNLFYSATPGVVQITWGGSSYTSLAAFQAAGTGQEVNGLQADPLFLDPAQFAERPPAAPFNMAINVGDYHIISGSPAIDSANSAAPNEQTVDIEGNPRFDDPATPNTGNDPLTYDDRGAYEFTKIAQVITITAPDPFPTSAVYNTSFTVTATGGGSGNPVTIAGSGSCSGTGDNSALITMMSGIGDCTVTLNQAGNAEYSAAPTLTKTVTAEKAPQTITITAPDPFPTSAVYTTSFTTTATGGGSGNPVTILASGSCSGSGDGSALILMTSDTGDCTVTFDQAGTDNYSAATLSKIVSALKLIQIHLPLVYR